MAPRADLLTDGARAILDDMPPVLIEEPDIRAVAQVWARESERMTEKAELVRRQFFVSTADELLGIWETQLGITVREGSPRDEREIYLLGALEAITSAGEGHDWEVFVIALAGAAAYQEHDPDDPDGPPPYTVWVLMPFAPSSDRFAMAERLIRRQTPANTDIVITSVDGFRLDESQMDQELMRW